MFTELPDRFLIEVAAQDPSPFAVLLGIGIVIAVCGVLLALALGEPEAFGSLLLVGVVVFGVGSGITAVVQDTNRINEAVSILESEYGLENVEVSGEEFTAKGEDGQYVEGLVRAERDNKFDIIILEG